MAKLLFYVRAWPLFLALLVPRSAAAAWPTDPLINVPLCAVPSDQAAPTMVADGSGGAIVTWHDRRNGDNDVYVQRVNSGGVPKWALNGVALCAATGDQWYPAIVSDGAGGAIVAWGDDRQGAFEGNTDIYTQRINAAGLPQWTEDGVAICTAANLQISPRIVSDGAGGAIVTWGDYRGGTSDIYAQRVSAAGVCMWTANGEPLSTAPNDQTSPTTISDGHGGAIVAWGDMRHGTEYDVYAQRINAGGVPLWTADGVALCTAADDQMGSAIASDGAEGAIVTWTDYRSGGGDIYAQSLSAAGAPRWTLDGVAIATAPREQFGSFIVSDGSGGAIVVWSDNRGGAGYDVYIQRIDAAGVRQWNAEGVPLSVAAATQWPFPAVVSDGSDAAIVTWQDHRSGTDDDIYAQRVLPGGTADPAWPVGGRALCTVANHQGDPTIVADGAGGGIVAWADYRNSYNNSDVYAQRILANGQLGGDTDSVPEDVELTFTLDPVRPNPSRGAPLTVQFTLASAATASLELLDVTGRRIAAREVGSLGPGTHALDLSQGVALRPGVYFLRLTQGGSEVRARAVVIE